MGDRDALVRVDQTGTLHPVGRTASQELRARIGDFRLLASPNNVLLLRTGDSSLKLAGEIRTPGALYDIVGLVAQTQWRGELVVYAEDGIRTIFFDRGSVIGAITNVPEERLGELLYRFGVLTREQLDELVTASTRTGKRLGESAIELSLVDVGTLYPMMARQVEEVLYGALQVKLGSFYFFDRFDEKAIQHRQNLNASGLLMEGARRVDEMRFFREKIPNDAYIPTKVPGKTPHEVELLPVFEKCDGASSVAEIGRLTGQLEFEVTRAIFQLTSGGYVTLAASKPKGAEAIIEVYNPALAAIHESSDHAQKGQGLRDGLSSFATGAGVYDPLFIGAGPAPDGTLNGERLAKNLAALAGDDPDTWLVSLMDDYVSFALFQAESLLGRERAQHLADTVKQHLQPLRGTNEDRQSKLP
jgi:hypothetical protein